VHCLVLDGVYRSSAGAPLLHEARAPWLKLEALLSRIIQRIPRLLRRTGYLIEEQGMRYLAEADPDSALTPLQVASCTYRPALRATRRAKNTEPANPPQPGGRFHAAQLPRRQPSTQSITRTCMAHQRA
jgi:hypothetical protein